MSKNNLDTDVLKVAMYLRLSQDMIKALRWKATAFPTKDFRLMTSLIKMRIWS